MTETNIRLVAPLFGSMFISLFCFRLLCSFQSVNIACSNLWENHYVVAPVEEKNEANKQNAQIKTRLGGLGKKSGLILGVSLFTA